MQNYPFISIALCTHNGEKYLEQQLDSLLEQTYQNIEIIVVDDCSSDNTVNILERYASKDKRIIIYTNQSNLGFNKNFEKAFTLCKGEYIAICDQDDIWRLDKIKLLIDNIGSCSLIYSNSELIDERGNLLGRTLLDKCIRYTGDDPRVFSIYNFIAGHNILFKRTLLQKALPIPKDVIYDWWLCLVATNYGVITVLDKSLVQYRQHANNSIKKWGNTKRAHLIIIKNFLSGVLTLQDLKYRDFFKRLLLLVNRRLNNRYHPQIVFFLIRNVFIVAKIFDRPMLSKLNRLRERIM